MNDGGGADGRRRETPHERLDRNFAEMLQELRVAQTGVQILFAFLLTLPFAARFGLIQPRDRAVYVAVLGACAAAIVLLIAPVTYHRLIFRQDRKAELVDTTSILMVVGVACLLVAIVGAVFLVIDVVLSVWPAVVIASATAILASTVWYALPLSRRRSVAPNRPGHAGPGVAAARTEEPMESGGNVRLNPPAPETVDNMATIDSLDALAGLVAEMQLGRDLYVRWSRGPAADLGDVGRRQFSQDELTGVALPGLSANALRVEPWWQDRSLKEWVARRLYDYRHLQRQHGDDVRPWILLGEEQGRGPDNEPLVVCVRPLAWVAQSALHQCEALVNAQPT